MTRSVGSSVQLLIFFRHDPDGLPGSQTPGGTIEPGETPLEAAYREATEETGLTQFGPPTLLAQDDYDYEVERLERHFFHLPVLEQTPDAWSIWSDKEGGDETIELALRWVDFHDPEDLAPFFRAYMDRVPLPKAV